MAAPSPRLSRILAALEKVRGPDAKGWWTALCPFHADREHPNLRVKETGFCCMACDERGNLQKLSDRLGLTEDALEAEADILAAYGYRDEEKRLLYEVVRKAPKRFLQRRPDGNGGWIWKLDGVRRVLYRLPELVAADPAQPVFVVEGEKDVDRLRSLGLIATCNVGGGGKWRDAYGGPLLGRVVYVVPDNDDVGRLHAEQVAQSLRGTAADVRIVRLPDLAEKGDVSDWLDSGRTTEELLQLAASDPQEPVVDEAPAVALEEPYCFVPATTNAFVEDFVRWREQANDAALEYAEAHAIATLAAVAGPRLRIPVREKPRPVACNLLVVLVGPSTLSRKSDVQNHTQVQLQDVVPDQVIEAPGSAEGFVQDLARHETIGAVLCVDELAWWFAAIKRKTYLSEMKGYVMRAYDGSTISRRNRTKTKKSEGESKIVEDCDLAQEPCLTVLGTSTPERLAQVSALEDIDDGWWPRWVIVYPDKRPQMRPMGPPDDEVERLRASIADRLLAIDKRLHTGVQAILTPEAWVMANNAFTNMEASVADDPEFGPFISRMELRLLKVAALLALADDINGKGNVMVSEDHVLQAEVLCDRWLGYAKKFAGLVGMNEFEYGLNKAWTALQRSGGKASRRELARAAHVPARVMDEIEKTLEDRGMIEVAEVNTGGRSRKEWRAIS